MDVTLSLPPKGLVKAYNELFTDDSVAFIADLTRAFKHKVRYLFEKRQRVWKEVKNGEWSPIERSSLFPEIKWFVDDVPVALKDRRIHLGDVSPCNLSHFASALSADVQGIQVDFDDGHCPSWRNQISGHYNVYCAVRGLIPNLPDIKNSPVIMFRPRAWNMTEKNMMVDGEPVPGPLFDYGLHVFHNAEKLAAIERGPFFYLSKIESSSEAELWDDIFVWTEKRFQFPIGTVKATVLIEDILAAFQMDQILFALKRHSAGLNCGIWDYSASIIARFGHKKEFLMPDRNLYVNMDKMFLKKYMALAVAISRSRGSTATGGMASSTAHSEAAVEAVVNAKRKEIEAGVAGFLIYDIKLIPAMKKLWKEYENRLVNIEAKEEINFSYLMQVPSGCATKTGLTTNIQVALLFIQNWLNGIGHFVFKNCIEDSASAEISRWQVHQWLVHQARLENTNELVTIDLVLKIVATAVFKWKLTKPTSFLFISLLTMKEPPQFITSFLSDKISEISSNL